MSTTVTITFSGLCMFTKDTGGKGDVLVRLPNAASGGAMWCGNGPLGRHCGRLISGHGSWALGGLKLAAPIDGGGSKSLPLPSDLASVGGYSGGCNVGKLPTSDRVLAYLRLKGGRWWPKTKAVRAVSPLSEGWADPKNPGKAKSLRWQATWEGTIAGDRLSLKTDTDDIVLHADAVSGRIDLVVLNSLPKDIREWQKPGGADLPAGPDHDAIHFPWFFWMYDWRGGADCAAQDFPRRHKGPGTKGLPYTCVLGGS